MHLLAPDILADARNLSLTVLASGFAVGLLLWLLGWWCHRFWIVLATTVAAGFVGLYGGPVHGAQPLVAGLLLAVAVGGLALALARMIAFAAGGLTLWLAVHALVPSWDEPFICFLGGGLVGLLLFRIWTKALTSFVGSVLMVYSGLAAADWLGKLDAVLVAEKKAALLNLVCAAGALSGLAAQFLMDRHGLPQRACNALRKLCGLDQGQGRWTAWLTRFRWSRRQPG